MKAKLIKARDIAAERQKEKTRNPKPAAPTAKPCKTQNTQTRNPYKEFAELFKNLLPTGS